MNLETLIKKYVPLFVGLGLLILLGTFLGPIGIVAILAGIFGIIFFILKYIKSQF